MTGQKVQVLRNVGNVGPCWIPGVYKRLEGKLHIVELHGGDNIEIVKCGDDELKVTPA